MELCIGAGSPIGRSAVWNGAAFFFKTRGVIGPLGKEEELK
ncbi:hypothetical protein [Streptococcus sp. 263_SSPC]|nr:hypothetical protein [Streptococcus sp. 263_SSPC]